MLEKQIRFGHFSIPRLSGLEYLWNKEAPDPDYLLVNEPRGEFSICFEKGVPRFSVPEQTEWDYCLLEMKRANKTIHLFCPERHSRLCSAVWYFCVELLDVGGVSHELPGQVRLRSALGGPYTECAKPRLLSLLERIELQEHTSNAQVV